MTEKITVGLLVERRLEHGSDYLIVRPLLRRPGDNFPTNPGNTVFAPWDSEAPKHLHNLCLDGIELRGHVYRFGNHDPEVIGMNEPHTTVYRADYHELIGLAKAMKRINNAIEKARRYASEHALTWTTASVVAPFAKAIGAKWYAVPSEMHYSSYRDVAWEWKSIADATTCVSRHVDDMTKLERV